MKLNLDKQYYSIYLVAAIMVASFAFMIVSTVVVMRDIGGGQTSGDLARKKAKKECERQNGQYVRVSEKNPINMTCIIQPDGERKN